MKILHLLSVKNSGGASNAAMLLNEKLVENGIKSEILFIDDLSKQDLLIKVQRVMRKKIDDFPQFFYRKRKRLYFTNSYLRNKQVEKKIKHLNPDVLHVHWIGNGNFALKQLIKLNIPVVWTMHDEWIYTGGCHNKIDCKRIDKQCGLCPILKSRGSFDLSRMNYRLKKRTLDLITDIRFIAPSKWIEKESKRSELLQGKGMYQISNIFDQKNFKILDKIESRKAINLPINETLILVGSVGIQTDEIKGYQYIEKVVSLLRQNHRSFVAFGNETNLFLEDEGRVNSVISLGNILEREKLNQIYSSADIFLFPSKIENLSYAIVESIFSGTPVVAFDVGGNSELITHKINGYLAKPYDVADLVVGIEWVLANNLKQTMQKSDNELKNETYDVEQVIKKIISVYDATLRRSL